MDSTLKDYCDSFIDYRNEAQRTSGFLNGHRLLYPIIAYIYLAKGQMPNEEMIGYCRTILKDYGGTFSYFKGIGEPIYTTLLATEEDPGNAMQSVLAAYDALKNYFSFNPFLPLLAFSMYEISYAGHYYEIAERTSALYQKMKNEHLIITAKEDVPLAGLLAMNGRNLDELIDEIEFLYENLNEGGLLFSNTRQTLSHILCLCAGSPDYKLNNYYSFQQELTRYGLKVYKDFNIVPIAVLSNLGLNQDKTVQDFVDVYNHLGTYRRYSGLFGETKKKRFQHAALVLSAYYLSDSVELLTAVTVSAILEMLAEQSAAAAT